MGRPRSGDAALRFSAYVEGLTMVIGHPIEPDRFAIIAWG